MEALHKKLQQFIAADEFQLQRKANKWLINKWVFLSLLSHLTENVLVLEGVLLFKYRFAKYCLVRQPQKIALLKKNTFKLIKKTWSEMPR